MTIEDVQDQPEEVNSVQSADYTSFGPLTPGKYLSESREVIYKGEGQATLDEATAKAAGLGERKVVVKTHKFEVRLNGLVDTATGRTLKRPDRAWFDTRPKRERVFGSRDQFHPGVTSDFAKYLTSCGFTKQELANINPNDAAIRDSIIEASKSRPVMVRTGLKPKGKKAGTNPATGKDFYRTPGNPAPGVYEGKALYTSAFKTADGKYKATAVDENGEEWQAQETVEGWARVGA